MAHCKIPIIKTDMVLEGGSVRTDYSYLDFGATVQISGALEM